MGCAVALAAILGAWLSSKLLKRKTPNLIIQSGIQLSLIGSLLLCVSSFLVLPIYMQVLVYILGIFIILTGIGMALPNCLSLALSKFSEAAGTAGAFLSLGYYIIVSICTFLISLLHTGSILIFPLFCTGLLLISMIFLKLAK